MKFKSIVNSIVNDYNGFAFECSRTGVDMEANDDKLYKEWLDALSKKIAKKIAKNLSKDLVDLCEDNEVMAQAIEEYFCTRDNEYPEEELTELKAFDELEKKQVEENIEE